MYPPPAPLGVGRETNGFCCGLRVELDTMFCAASAVSIPFARPRKTTLCAVPMETWGRAFCEDFPVLPHGRWIE
ncbi:hypothetical protein THAOC_19312, partial [Thalassiosira oceanica]